MQNDPVVNEIHQIRENLIKEVNGDLHVYFEKLRNERKKDAIKPVKASDKQETAG